MYVYIIKLFLGDQIMTISIKDHLKISVRYSMILNTIQRDKNKTFFQNMNYEIWTLPSQGSFGLSFLSSSVKSYHTEVKINCD